MRPKDLKTPFKFADRRPIIQDGVFYVPVHYEAYQAVTMPSWEELFGNTNPVHVEFCSGNGEWILDKAEAHPEINWVANEMQFERVRKIVSKRTNRNVKNLFVVCGKAQDFSREYLPDSSVDATYVNFPDPWPKDRHAKHRLIQAPFVSELKRIMKPHAAALFVTDHTEYSKQMEQEMHEWNFEPLEEVRKASYGSSFFERLWRSHGLDIHFLHYRNPK